MATEPKQKQEKEKAPKVYKLKLLPRVATEVESMDPMDKDLLEAYAKGRYMGAKAADLEARVVEVMRLKNIKEVNFPGIGILRTREATSAKTPTQEEAQSQVDEIDRRLGVIFANDVAQLDEWFAEEANGTDRAAWLESYMATLKQSRDLWARFLVYLSDKALMAATLAYLKEAGVVLEETKSTVAYHKVADI
jgi:hypothetical protein